MKIVNERSKFVTPAEHKLVVKLARKCIRELSKRKYELPPLDRYLIVATKAKGQRSYGGSGRISIDITDYRAGAVHQSEYDGYRNEPLIGNFHGTTKEQALLCKIAHEVAHHVQHRYAPFVSRFDDYKKPHGRTFKTIYRYLRVALLNEHQKETAAAC